MDALQAEPNRLRTGRVGTLAIDIAAKLRDETHHLAQPRRFLRWVFSADPLPSRFPFGRFEYRFATHLGATPSQATDIQCPPGHDQVYRQASQQTIKLLKPSLLHAAPRLEHTEEHFDHPP